MQSIAGQDGDVWCGSRVQILCLSHRLFYMFILRLQEPNLKTGASVIGGHFLVEALLRILLDLPAVDEIELRDNHQKSEIKQ